MSCYCIGYGCHEIHELTQWTSFFFWCLTSKGLSRLNPEERFDEVISINRVERFDDKMGSAYLSFLFFVASPTSCTCMVVETKGPCWACLIAQDLPSLSRRPWLRCAGSRTKKLRRKRYYGVLCRLCVCACTHTYTIHTHFYIASYPLNIMSLHWTSWHCIALRISVMIHMNSRNELFLVSDVNVQEIKCKWVQVQIKWP